MLKEGVFCELGLEKNKDRIHNNRQVELQETRRKI